MSPNGSDRSPRRRVRRKLPLALALGLVVATATGCTSKDLPRLGMPTPITNQGPRVLHLWQGSWLAALAVGCLVWGLIIWACIFYRRSRHHREIPPQSRYNLPIEALYTIIPIVMVSVFFYFTAKDESAEFKISKPQHVINVVGFQWSWAFNYESKGDLSNPKVHATAAAYDVGSPQHLPTLWLPEGQSVEFELTSRDVIHSFWVPNFLFKLDVIPGRVNKFQVTPTRLGTFKGRCAELCGVYHSEMLFNVKVVTPAQYQQHLKDLKAKGQSGGVNYGVTTTGIEK